MEKISPLLGVTPSCADASSGNGASGESFDGEEDASETLDEDSSTPNVEDQLDNFRSQWKLELENNTLKSSKKEDPCFSKSGIEACDSESNIDSKEKTIEEKAKEFFNQGIHAEEAGLLYEAVSFYKKAVQLVPDIEFRISEQSVRPRDRNISEGSGEDVDPSVEEEEEEQDLIVRFQHYRQKNDGQYCQPVYEQKGTHISDLPLEVLMYILKWVVSVDLDLKSLEHFSMVCRGFYLCSRDEEIWRLACIRIWGLKCTNRHTSQSWRHMYLEKHHLRFNGCYISKTTYVRHGETSYIDETYRPWYLVEYYRYLRFFPEGIVLMLTTPDNPYTSLSKLRFRAPRFTSVMAGHYRLNENRMTAILKRKNIDANANGGMYRRKRRGQSENVENCDSGEQTFHLELEVEHVKKRPNYRLSWKHYAIHTRYKNGQEAVAKFDLSPNNYTPFWFSVVKSYVSLAEKPLM